MTRTRHRVDGALLASVQALLARRDARPLPTGHVRPELKITAQADGSGAELLIYDEISWWGVCAVDVAAALSTVSGPLHVKINSPGGDVFDGVTIYNLLLDYPGDVTVTVDGLAASAASFIAMAGDKIIMNRASQMMIHDAGGFCYGNAADLRAYAALLDMVSGTIAGIYAARSGTDADTWRERMLADGGVGTWYTADQAVNVGLADEMIALAERSDPNDRTRLDTVAALFPYGTADSQGRWGIAALLPPTHPTEQQTATADSMPTDAAAATAPTDQVPAASAPPTPMAAHPQPPAETAPQSAPAPPADPAATTSDVEPDPDWDELVSHLLEPPASPSSDDVLAAFREAM